MNLKYLKNNRILFYSLSLLPLIIPMSLVGEVTPEDGDWSEKTIVMVNTPETALMARTGDIDNLGFGWPNGFNPFSGNNTPSHPYPWNADPLDPPGTDKIMVPSSYVGTPPSGRDGYTTFTSRPENLPEAITISYDIPEFEEIEVSSAAMQLFVDDFQAPVWGSSFQVTLNERRAPFLEEILNGLRQTGPIGKLITVQVPSDFLDVFSSGKVELFIDDPVTGAGDGYAIDFVKILINPVGFSQTATVTGIIRDQRTQTPLMGAVVSVGSSASEPTDETGFFRLPDVPAGLTVLTITCPGYNTSMLKVETIAEKEIDVNFSVSLASPSLKVRPMAEGYVIALEGALTAKYTLWSSEDLEEWSALGEMEQIAPGCFEYIISSPFFEESSGQRFYRVLAE